MVIKNLIIGFISCTPIYRRREGAPRKEANDTDREHWQLSLNVTANDTDREHWQLALNVTANDTDREHWQLALNVTANDTDREHWQLEMCQECY